MRKYLWIICAVVALLIALLIGILLTGTLNTAASSVSRIDNVGFIPDDPDASLPEITADSSSDIRSESDTRIFC